ncbi:MAG: hypothetical protein GY867_09505 [bacterium]|nr:hypothetical protein [bacterium]
MDSNSEFCRKKKGRQTAPFVDALAKKIRITHPFHPLFNQEFELVSYRRSWRRETLDCLDQNGRLINVPLDWTDAAAEDPFVVIAAGRSYFRVEDLIRLADLVDDLKQGE